MPAPPSANLLDVFEAEELEHQANRWCRSPWVVYVHIDEPTGMAGRGFIITSMGSRQISPLDLFRRRACAPDQHRRRHGPMDPRRAAAQSSANRPKQTTQGRPIHNAC